MFLHISILFKITRFLDFVHRPVLQKLGKKFRKLDLLLSSGEGGEDTYSVGSLRKG
jgi:hypothetical protein